MPRLPALLAVLLAVAGCHLTSVEAVQAVAGDDFSCPGDKVKVTPAQDKDTFLAAGCGKKGTYVCEGWDSYNQSRSAARGDGRGAVWASADTAGRR